VQLGLVTAGNRRRGSIQENTGASTSSDNDRNHAVREPATALKDGEIAVAANEELHVPRSRQSVAGEWTRSAGASEKRERKLADRAALSLSVGGRLKVAGPGAASNAKKRPQAEEDVVDRDCCVSSGGNGRRGGVGER